jgi:ribosome-associated protein
MNASLKATLRQALSALEDKKAYHVVALDVSTRTSVADVFVICSAGSQRHAQAVVDEVARVLSAHGARPLSIEGYKQGGWILMDYGDIIVHVFLEERREYFALERLWGDAPEIDAGLQAAWP